MDTPILASLYDPDDNEEVTDLPPRVHDVWSADNSRPDDLHWLTTMERVGELYKQAVTAKALNEANTVMDVQFHDGTSAVARVLVGPANTAKDSAKDLETVWRHAKLFAEYCVLRWLAVNAPSLPVPRILAFDQTNGLLITTLMPGLDAMHVYPQLNTEARENSILSWAHTAVHMFRLPVPQQFGTIETPVDQRRTHLYISPKYTFFTDKTPDLHSFFESVISTRRARSEMLKMNDEITEMDYNNLGATLDRLSKLLSPLITAAESTPCMSRFALTHRDPSPYNIMLNETSGEVVGVVDWEFNGCMPACMATDYPSWIRFPIIESPRYPNPKATFNTYFFDQEGERNRLCDLYEKAVKELDEECHTCLIRGTRLRDALTWIEVDYSDKDGVGMDRWVNEHLSEYAENSDHRCA